MKANETEASKKTPRTLEVSTAVKRELADLPPSIRRQFLVALEQLTWDLEPGITVRPLKAVGQGILELKINGSPGFRLVYTMKFTGLVVVLAARPKTTNGTDRQLVEVAASRLKAR